MPGGLTERQDRQDREVFQRNMKSRMETFKSSRHKRHKKERSLKKVNKRCHDSGTHTSNTHTLTNTFRAEETLHLYNCCLLEGDTVYPLCTSCFLSQRRGSDSKDDGDDKPRRNVSWHDKSEYLSHSSNSSHSWIKHCQTHKAKLCVGSLAHENG